MNAHGRFRASIIRVKIISKGDLGIIFVAQGWVPYKTVHVIDSSFEAQLRFRKVRCMLHNRFQVTRRYVHLSDPLSCCLHNNSRLFRFTSELV